MATLATLTVSLIADTADFASKMNSAGSVAGQLGSKLTGVGTTLTAGLTLPLVGIGAAAVNAASNFESQVNIMSLAAKSSGTSMETLSSAALQVGSDVTLVGIDASQAAEGITNLYKAGLTTTDIFGDLNGYMAGTSELSGALRSAVDLQAASELDLAAASDLVSVAMATWGLSADEATGIADSFVQSADASVASVQELYDAMVNLGPTAAAFGISLQDTNAALAILSERGIKGAEAGTALKSMLTNMMRDTPKVKKAWKDLGVSLYDAEGNMRALPDVIGDLEGALGGLTEEQRNQYIQTLAGTYGMKALQTLLAEGSSGWEDMTTRISEAATAQEVASARTQGFKASMENLQGVVETFLIQQALPFIQEFLTPAIQKLSEFVSSLSGVDPNIMRIAIVIGAVLAAAGPLLLILGMLISAFGAISGAVSAVGAALGAVVGVISGPVLLVIGLIIGALVLLYLAWKNNWFGIRDIVAQVVAWISTQISAFVAQVQSWWAAHGENLMFVAQNVWNFILGVIRFVVGVVVAVVTWFVTLVQNIWAQHGSQIMALVRRAWETIKTVIANILTIIGASIDAWAAIFRGDWSALLEALKTGWAAAWNIIKAVGAQIWAGLKLGFQIFLTALKFIWDTLLNALSLAWETIWNGIKVAGEAIWLGIQSALQGVANFLGGIWDGLMKLLGGGWEGGWNTIKSVGEGAWGTIKGGLETFAGDSQKEWDGMVTDLGSQWDTGWNDIKTVGQKLWEEIRILFLGWIEEFVEFWEESITGISDLWAEAWATIKAVLIAMGGEIIGIVTGIVNDIKGAFKINWGEVGSAIAKGIAAGLKNGASAIVAAAVSAAKKALAAAKAALGIKSPSREFMKLGMLSMKGYALALGDTSEVIRAADRLAKDAVEPLKSVGDTKIRPEIETRRSSASYNLTIHTNAPTENVVNDFGLMKAWGRA